MIDSRLHALTLSRFHAFDSCFFSIDVQVLGNQGFMEGRNYWEIRIDRSPTAYLFVGVALRQANLSTFLGGDQHGWGYIGDRALYHKRSKLKLYGDRFGQGDVIGVTLDMDEGTLSFSRNGIGLGVAIQHLSGVIYPAVAFYNRGQREWGEGIGGHNVSVGSVLGMD